MDEKLSKFTTALLERHRCHQKACSHCKVSENDAKKMAYAASPLVNRYSCTKAHFSA